MTALLAVLVAIVYGAIVFLVGYSFGAREGFDLGVMRGRLNEDRDRQDRLKGSHS